MPRIVDSVLESLDRVVFFSFLLVFAGALSIGAFSILQVERMMHRMYVVEEESHNVDFINHLQNKAYLLILAIHHLVLDGDMRHVRTASDLEAEISTGIDEYLRHEHASPHPESQREIALLRQLQVEVQKLRELTRSLEDSRDTDTGAPTVWHGSLDLHASSIQTLTRQINDLHFELITRKVRLAQENRALIFRLYVAFSLVGLILVYAGYRIHSRNVVRPLVGLAEAATRVREGDLGVRVESDSRNEIGQLQQAFNGMVARLQTHEDEMLTLNRNLEDKVHERTRELEEAQAELVRFEKMALLGQIATSVNHEVRTPLNALYLNVQLIRRLFETCGTELNPTCRARQESVQDRLKLIEEEVLRISDMLEEFVRYARLEPPKLEDIDIGQVVRRVTEMIDERAKQAGVSLQLALPEPTPRVRADENKLIQALLNLCTNAFHAMPEGGRLELSVVQEADVVRISLADTGTGIPEADLDRIFRPFYTSKTTGLGFGLSIVQRIVEDHGGSVHCESRVGEGTTFIINLPVTEPEPHASKDPAESADRR